MNSVKQRLRDIRLISRTVQIVWKCCPYRTLISFIIMIFQGGLPVVPVYLIKLIIDAVAAGQSFAGIVPLIIGIGGAIVLNTLLKTLGGYVGQSLSLIVSDHMQERMQDKSREFDLSFYDDPEFFDKMYRAQQQAPSLPSEVIGDLMDILRSGISSAGIAGLLIFNLPWYIMLVLVAASLPSVIVRIINSRRFYTWYMEHTTVERRGSYLHGLLTSKAHSKELRLLGLGPLLKERYGDIRDELQKEKLSLFARRSGGEFFSMGLQSVVTAALIGYFAYHSIHSSGSLGNLVLFFQAIQKGQQVLGELLHSGAELYETTLFLQNLFEFMDLSPSVKTSESPRISLVDTPGITVEKVSFSYPGTERRVLNEVSLRAGPGEFIAIVGDNGAGKSTLIKLLCRLYHPTEGTIRLNGEDMRFLDEQDVSSCMSVLMQDYVQYHFSASENIWLGDVSRKKALDKIIRAAEKAGADGTLSSLPKGYETMLGRWIEEGIELSGGQWKKVALARILFREAPLVILDEPTASLDPMSETEFIDSLPHIAEGRSLVMISHKIASVRQADRIYVMREGQIIESGSHEELVSLNGFYAGLYHTQLRQMG